MTFAFFFSEDGVDLTQHATGLDEADVLAQAARVLRQEPGSSFLEALTGGRGFQAMTTKDNRVWLWKQES